MSSYQKKHAIHNKTACDYLIAKGDFSDWVVTTCFYSALHFVQDELFPCEIGSRKYISFENYYNGHYGNSKNKPSKHVSTINLVYNQIGDDAGAIYKWLHDTCRTARYRKYDLNPSIAKNSIDRLDELRTYLSK